MEYYPMIWVFDNGIVYCNYLIGWYNHGMITQTCLGKSNHISLTWIVKGHVGMISLINHDSRARENSEVVIIYPDR